MGNVVGDTNSIVCHLVSNIADAHSINLDHINVPLRNSHFVASKLRGKTVLGDLTANNLKRRINNFPEQTDCILDCTASNTSAAAKKV
jgi:hypothetical protein